MAPWHLSDTDRAALEMYRRYPEGCHAGHLARSLGMPRSTAGQIQESLWRRGFLRRIKDRLPTAERGTAELYVIASRAEDEIGPSRSITLEENRAGLEQLSELLNLCASADPAARSASDTLQYLKERFPVVYLLGDGMYRRIRLAERKLRERSQ